MSICYKYSLVIELGKRKVQSLDSLVFMMKTCFGCLPSIENSRACLEEGLSVYFVHLQVPFTHVSCELKRLGKYACVFEVTGRMK